MILNYRPVGSAWEMPTCAPLTNLLTKYRDSLNCQFYSVILTTKSNLVYCHKAILVKALCFLVYTLWLIRYVDSLRCSDSCLLAGGIITKEKLF